jgi:hypothetical protein
MQMLASFLTPFKEGLLQLEVNTYATLLLVLPISFNLLKHQGMLVADSHGLDELKKPACMIQSEKCTIHKFHRITLLL